MFFVFIWEQTVTCATYSINCAVRTGSLNKAICALSVKGQKLPTHLTNLHWLPHPIFHCRQVLLHTENSDMEQKSQRNDKITKKWKMSFFKYGISWWCQLLRTYSISHVQMNMNHWWHDIDGAKPLQMEENITLPVRLWPPEIPWGLAWDWTEASTHTAGNTLLLAHSILEGWGGRKSQQAVIAYLKLQFLVFSAESPKRKWGFKI